jgi:hypothetical protein
VPDSSSLKYLEDYYLSPDGKMIFTESYHLKRGYCCGSGCLHCPYDGIGVREGDAGSTESQVQCPFCHEFFSLPVFKEEGSEQNFIYDCEICCSPIRIQVSFTEDDLPEISTDRS